MPQVWILASSIYLVDSSLLREDFSKKIIDFWLLRRNPDSPRRLENAIIFDITRYSSSHFSVTFSLTSSIKVLIDSFSLVEVFSNCNVLISAQATKFSWQAENAEKCRCYCYFVNIQTHKFLRLSAWSLPTRSLSATLFLVGKFVSNCCMFNQSFLISPTENIAVRLRLFNFSSLLLLCFFLFSLFK